MDNDWLRNLKTGDKVIYHSNPWNRNTVIIAAVEKITPKGFIKVRGSLFNPQNGYVRGDSHCWIEEATGERIMEIEQKRMIMYVLNRVWNLKDITYEQAVELNNLLNSWGENE